MNMPHGINAFLFPTTEQKEMGTVETPVALRVLRPATMALWLIIFAAQVQTILATGSGVNWVIIALSTALFAGIHFQFWYEESEQGRRFHHTIERMRGRIYEDDSTGLPNSRHFVFELRRQMMRSVRNGRGFSLILTDIVGFETLKRDEERLLSTMGRAFRQSLGEADFSARLQGPIFAAIVADDRDGTTTEKAQEAREALQNAIPVNLAGSVLAVVSVCGYEGELEVRDFLRRAQRDLIGNRSRDAASARPPMPARGTNVA